MAYIAEVKRITVLFIKGYGYIQTERKCLRTKNPAKIKTVINYGAVVELQGKDMETFIEYNSRDLTEREEASLKEFHELYKKHCK